MSTTTSATITSPPEPSAPGGPAKPNPFVVAGTLCQRELVRFLRQRNRVFGALGQPIIFWLLFSEGFASSRDGAFGLGYGHFFPGTLAMILLFTAIFATVSIIEDRREGFLQSVLVAPIPRWSMVLGKVLGGTLLALLQAVVFLVLGALTLDIGAGPLGYLALIALMFVVGLALTSLGFVLAWRMDSVQGFHAIMMLFLLPMWLLSGAFFPSESGVLGWVVRINPLTYGVSGMRQLLQLDEVASDPASLPWCWAISLLFAAAMFALAWKVAQQRTSGDLL